MVQMVQDNSDIYPEALTAYTLIVRYRRSRSISIDLL